MKLQLEWWEGEGGWGVCVAKTVCPREGSKLNGETGGVQGRERLRPCVGRGRRQRCPVYFRWNRRQRKPGIHII